MQSGAARVTLESHVTPAIDATTRTTSAMRKASPLPTVLNALNDCDRQRYRCLLTKTLAGWQDGWRQRLDQIVSATPPPVGSFFNCSLGLSHSSAGEFF